MNRSISYILFLGATLYWIGCKKTTSLGSNGNGVSNVFTQNISNIQKEEPVLLSFDAGNDTTAVLWQVSPATNYTITAAGAYASFLWQEAGNYTVTALAGNLQATYHVAVISSIYTETDTTPRLTVNKQLDVLAKEKIVFTLQNNTNTNVIWQTSGNTNFANTTSNPAYFSFAFGTIGTVYANVDNKVLSRTIWLKDATEASRGKTTIPFLFSDKLTITPSVFVDGNNKKALVLTAKTAYLYQSNQDSIVHYLDTYNDGEYALNYGGIKMASTPQANKQPAFSSDTLTNMVIGRHLLSINVGNKTLTGSITLNAAGVFSFELAKNNFVNIYPTTVQ